MGNEEQFFLFNQLNNAVLSENLHELRRALNHALSLGIDSQDLEIEIAYRDALAKHQQSLGFTPNQVIHALQRGDWWTALDDIIKAASASGADKHMLLKALTRLC